VIGTDVLHNPAWSALTGPQAHLALARGRARCFPLDLSPFAALPDGDLAAWDDLAALAAPGEVRALADVAPPPPASAWELVERFDGVQLVGGEAADDGDPAAEAAAAGWDVVRLGTADVPEMLDLVKRTEPGPFGPRTVDFGGFVGVRVDGALVAMAGRRLRVPGWTEVSGVCTAPELRGRGLGALLTRLVSAELRALGDRPFLHAVADNAVAIRLYESLGFTLRRELPFLVVRRVAAPVSRR
jgi:ribosomal protein S18 acetylase RimI-like enzyme